jgi:hypothetical protein
MGWGMEEDQSPGVSSGYCLYSTTPLLGTQTLQIKTAKSLVSTVS